MPRKSRTGTSAGYDRRRRSFGPLRRQRQLSRECRRSQARRCGLGKPGPLRAAERVAPPAARAFDSQGDLPFLSALETPFVRGGAVKSVMSHVRERFRLWRLRRAERLGTLSSGEQDELRRLQDDHGTLHIGEPRARMYGSFEDDSKKPRY